MSRVRRERTALGRRQNRIDLPEPTRARRARPRIHRLASPRDPDRYILTTQRVLEAMLQNVGREGSPRGE